MVGIHALERCKMHNRCGVVWIRSEYPLDPVGPVVVPVRVGGEIGRSEPIELAENGAFADAVHGIFPLLLYISLIAAWLASFVHSKFM